MFSWKRCNFDAPGIGTKKGFLANNQSNAICASTASLSTRLLKKHIDITQKKHSKNVKIRMPFFKYDFIHYILNPYLT